MRSTVAVFTCNPRLFFHMRSLVCLFFNGDSHFSNYIDKPSPDFHRITDPLLKLLFGTGENIGVFGTSRIGKVECVLGNT